MPRGRGGLLTLVGKKVGQGVGLVSEYRQHRQSQQLSRENSEQSQHLEAAESSVHASSATSPSQDTSSSYAPPEGPPPNYGEATVNERDLESDFKSDLKSDDHDRVSDSIDPNEPSLLIQDDEEYWELDEIVSRRDSRPSDPSLPDIDGIKMHDGEEGLVQDRDISRQVPQNPLPCPVIIPQRRPGSRTRGFVRAYAPVLDDCGISQESFLKLLDDFDKSSQASPVLTVISISAAIVGFVPEVTAMIVATVVQTAAQVAIEVQGRTRTNNYLDRMNEQIFKPAGLFAFIMKYKPDQATGGMNNLASMFGIRSQAVDLSSNQIIAKYNAPVDLSAAKKQSKLSNKLQSVRLASGTTKGSAALPVSAPLIFPDIDAAARKEGEETLKDKAKDAGNFLAGYLDRRAQSKYAASDPDSGLVLPEEQRAFKSKYADPNHPMYNNGLVGIVSGGKLGRNQGMGYSAQQGRSGSGSGQYGDDEYAYGDGTIGSRPGRGFRGRGRRSGGLIGGLVGLASNAISNRGSSSSSVPVSSQGSASYGGYTGSDPQEGPSTAFRPDVQSFDGVSNFDRGYESRASGGRGMQMSQGYRGRGSRQGGRGGPLSMVKKAMKEDILYLSIVNLPSDAELEEARQALGQLQSS